ncbi:hypothetical protein GN156_26145 [bacterium LRH843]|nr:hypothetical protein [bacterium LRH843]
MMQGYATRNVGTVTKGLGLSVGQERPKIGSSAVWGPLQAPPHVEQPFSVKSRRSANWLST